MNRKEALAFVKKLREQGEKKKFNQSVDFIINLQDLDFKKQDHNVDFFCSLHHLRGVPVSVCGLVGPELQDESKKFFDQTINVDDFGEFQKSKKITKKLANTHVYFVAQANIMAKVAATFGRILGPRNKMPNPKAGCVVPGSAGLEPLKTRLQKLVRVATKQRSTIHLFLGKEDMKDEDLADNLFDLYDQLIHHLPSEKNNIKSMFIKLTMGKPLKIYPSD